MPEHFVSFSRFPILCLLIFWAGVTTLHAQQLNLPPRPADAPKGSEFKEQVRNLALGAREDAIFEEVMGGNVPGFLRDLVPVTVTGSAVGSGAGSGNGSGSRNEYGSGSEDGITTGSAGDPLSMETLEVTYFVTPDYLAVGSDDDYFLMPMTPILAQRIANATGTTMPTRRMVNQIWQAAPLKLSPRTIPPSDQMTTISVMYEHHLMVWEQREPVLDEHPPGTLVGGHKKDVIISNRIHNQAGRVVIYGWHYLNGTPIQPLYSGHSETYADYSHGIRLVQDSLSVNGEPAHIRDLLQHPERHVLLSDEGMIPLSYYPTGDLLEVPDAWGVMGEDAGSLRLILGEAPGLKEYLVQLSADGRNFSPAFPLTADNPVITGLQTDSLVYVRLQAVGEQPGPFSEVLAGVPSEPEFNTANKTEPYIETKTDAVSEREPKSKSKPKSKSRPNPRPSILIVNGFNRPIAGNTRDFIRHYAPEVRHHGYHFDSVTNEAVGSGLVSLDGYDIVLWILGAESTADRTFDENERLMAGNFLHAGGAMLISGSEIGYDLGMHGSTADQQFLRNFLKSEFVADAPENRRDTFYEVNGEPGTLFGGLSGIRFDNGTQGTWNVSWPDVLRPVEGGIAVLRYAGVSGEDVAGVAFRGPFPRGEQAGAVVVLGFPFETVYPAETRMEMMGRILDFLGDPEGIDTASENRKGDGFDTDDPGRPGEFRLHQNYPNPFNNTTVIAYDLPLASDVRLTVHTVEGRIVARLSSGFLPAGRHSVSWDASGLASGV